MKPQELFERVRTLWPEAIVLRDQPIGGDQILQWSLMDTYEAIEKQIEDDEWLALGNWAFYQALFEIATTGLASGERSVAISSVTLASFDICMRDNLADESWEIERQQYGQIAE